MVKSLDELMNMSDEEIMGMPNITLDTSESNNENQSDSQNDSDPEDDDDNEIPSSGEPEQKEDGEDAEDKNEEDDDAPSGSDAPDNAKPRDASGKFAKQDKKPDGDAKPDAKAEDKPVTPPNYEQFYNQIMKPFKANGRDVTLNSPEEVISLMQKGANYTQKMQALQPHLKIVRMLQNNDLLDANKLNHLIDIAKGDKAALSKFVKDSGIDPMDMDEESAVSYKPRNHSVSDTEIQFEQNLEEINSNESGQALITQITQHWDQASKSAIFEKPELIHHLAAQKQNGIYDQIANVIHREKILGNPQIAHLPFLKAYEVVGQALQSQGKLIPKQPEASSVDLGSIGNAPQELGRGTAPNKPAVTNGDKAKAASPSGKSSKKASAADFNPLAMSDEEFMSKFGNG